MTATVHAAMVGRIPIVTAEASCVGCATPVRLVQLPGARTFTDDDTVCFRCVAGVRLRKVAA